jgi:HD-GYP domain-containing protein (c-di-GMP phosphodiesterase class II)
MVMTVLGIRFPIVWRANIELFVVNVPYVAMILLTPVSILGFVIALPVIIGYLWLRLRDPVEFTFNVSQTVIHVVLSGVVFALLKDQSWLGPSVAGIGSLGAIIASAAVLTASNYALVSGAASLQMGANFFRVWRSHFTRDLVTEATQSGIGVIAAIVAMTEPLAVPILAVPVVLVSISSRRASQLETDTHDALTRLVELLELRDAYTAGHSRRVAETAQVLALKLGLTPEEALVVESAGEVHDIGKIIIEPHILHKTERLTDAEFDVIKQHPAVGASIVSRFASYGEGHLMVRHHHERWDGGGYPDKLAGEDIPLGARIIAVADAFDAMTTTRSYRGAMSRERAIAILMEGAGVQWDARVVAVMLEHLGVEQGEMFRWPSLAAQGQTVDSAPATGI